MFMRLVQMKINPDKIFDFERVYERAIIPELQKTRGCVYAGLVQSLEDQAEGMSLTLWETQADALAYEQSGAYAQLIDKSRPFFSNSSEWKVQLSDDLRLEYGPVAPEPEVKSYAAEIPAQEQPGFPGGGAKSMYLRIVSMRINPEKIQESIQILRQEIIPALRKVEGCHDVYLAERVKEDHELLSITVWGSLEDARRYEESGEFDKLRHKIQHTFSNLALWKMGLDEKLPVGSHGMAKRAVTSDDLDVRTYSIVVGKAFK